LLSHGLYCHDTDKKAGELLDIFLEYCRTMSCGAVGFSTRNKNKRSGELLDIFLEYVEP
jgi:hypothetical protein